MAIEWKCARCGAVSQQDRLRVCDCATSSLYRKSKTGTMYHASKAITDEEHGKELGFRFLQMCEDEKASGTSLLNAIGNALVGFFMVTKFDNHRDRMKEVEQWCAFLRQEIDKAHGSTAAN